MPAWLALALPPHATVAPMRRALARTLAPLSRALAALVTLRSTPSARAEGAPAGGSDAVELRPAKRQAIYGLREILELSERNHPQIAAARAKVLQARAEL